MTSRNNKHSTNNITSHVDNLSGNIISKEFYGVGTTVSKLAVTDVPLTLPLVLVPNLRLKKYRIHN